MNKLTFAALRIANVTRLPVFKNSLYEPAHSMLDGSDWTPGDWLQAVVGELGEYANKRKKFQRGDITREEFAVEAAKELADVVIYLDLLALRCLDVSIQCEDPYGNITFQHAADPTGIDLGQAVMDKWNEVSERIGIALRIDENGVYTRK